MTTLIRTLLVYAVGAAAVVAVSAAASPAFAQLQSIPERAQGAPVAGWSLTPSLLFSRTYDDNVLLRGPSDLKISDSINVINPKADATYHGALGDFSAHYDGAFLAYQQSTGLNSFDQHAGINTRRRLSKRNTFFASASAQQSPTTELLQFVGVPYIRVGSFSDDVSAGLDTVVNKRLSFVTTGHFQQVRFDQNAFSALLFGGYTVGGGIGLRERLTARTTLTADYDYQHSTVGSQEDLFDVQNSTVGIDHQLSEGIHVFAAGGFSRVDVKSFGQSHVAPSWRLGLSDHYRATIIDIGFSRSYVPSFGYGGTLQNEEATASIKMPITRRLYTQAVASWRREDALVINAPQISSLWLQAAVGYTARAWFRVEGYYAATRQTTIGGLQFGALDGLMSHDQMGIQLVASKPMRIH